MNIEGIDMWSFNLVIGMFFTMWNIALGLIVYTSPTLELNVKVVGVYLVVDGLVFLYYTIISATYIEVKGHKL